MQLPFRLQAGSPDITVETAPKSKLFSAKLNMFIQITNIKCTNSQELMTQEW